MFISRKRRSVIYLDPDAKAYLDAAEVSSSSIRSAWNSFVLSCKSTGAWDKMYRVNPCPSQSDKADLRDATAICARTLTVQPYSGSLVLDATGAPQFDGSSYFDCQWSPNLFVSANNWHIGVGVVSYGLFPIEQEFILAGSYSNATTARYEFVFGDSKSLGNYIGPRGKRSNSNAYYDIYVSGILIGQRRVSGSLQYYANGSLQSSKNNDDSTGSLSSQSVYWGVGNAAGVPTTGTEYVSNFLTLGVDFTTTQLSTMATAFNAWNAANGR